MLQKRDFLGLREEEVTFSEILSIQAIGGFEISEPSFSLNYFQEL